MVFAEERSPHIRLDGMVGELREGVLDPQSRRPGALVIDEDGDMEMRDSQDREVLKSWLCTGSIQVYLNELIHDNYSYINDGYIISIIMYDSRMNVEHSAGLEIGLSSGSIAKRFVDLLGATGTSADGYSVYDLVHDVWEREVPNTHTQRPNKPLPRLVRDVDETETFVTEWIRWLGWPTAHRTSISGDGGVDVIGDDAGLGVVVGQVKFEAKPAGSPAIQALVGAGVPHNAIHFMFFTSAGYTAAALQYARIAQVALFQFSINGEITPVNEKARVYMEP